MLKLMMITNNPEIAKYAVQAGVNRIFIDLEIKGKKERQGHLDTVISNHTLEDIEIMRQCLPNDEILVRLNPLYEGSKEEIDLAIAAGADLLMLPMIKYKEEIELFSKLVYGRVGIIPLIETPQSMARLEEIVKVNGIKEVYFGLNDLHLGLGLDFMFEPLAGDLVDHMANICIKAGLPFGFGGIARIGEGLIPGELVLGEHLRIGSSIVILSRAFHLNAKNMSELTFNVDFKEEVAKLRHTEMLLAKRSISQISEDKLNAKKKINELSKNLRKEEEFETIN